MEAIAAKLGAKISYEPFEGQGEISGMLFRKNDNVVIGVNSAHAHTRQRFTIAHKIAHFLMHKGALFVDKTVRLDRDAKSGLAVDRQEMNAKQFAAGLLMPSAWVFAQAKKRIAKEVDLTADELVSQLADAFDVSEQAMEIRLTNLVILSQR